MIATPELGRMAESGVRFTLRLRGVRALARTESGRLLDGHIGCMEKFGHAAEIVSDRQLDRVLTSINFGSERNGEMQGDARPRRAAADHCRIGEEKLSRRRDERSRAPRCQACAA